MIDWPARFESHLAHCSVVCHASDHYTCLEVPAGCWLEAGRVLHDHPALSFKMFIDLSGVDYLHYGLSEWQTHAATAQGYDRSVDESISRRYTPWEKPRFAVVLQLLSIEHGQRVALKTFLEDQDWLRLDSLTSVWSGANWFEREAYDLYGIEFEGHPDMRRILTDYGFHGHPFRKDFPLIGEVEMHYDASQQQCVYGPVSIQPRTTVPKVIRDDHRYDVEGMGDQGGALL